MVRWTILAFDPSLTLVVIAQFLHGATYGFCHLGAMYFILKAVATRLSATAQSLYAVATNGVVMGLATFASGPLYADYGGRTYLLMSAMAVVAVFFALGLGHVWHGGRLTQQEDEESFDAI
jgi:PPP family 3-phenylpropionic acid transporter